MKIRLLRSLVAVLLCSAAAQAQHQGVEVFTGYSRAQILSRDSSVGFHGWNVAVSVDATKWIGLVVDVAGHYRDDQANTLLGPVDTNLRIKSVTFGPRVALRKHEFLTPFAHALIGSSSLKSESSLLGLSVSSNDSAFVVAAGGGLDIKLNRRFALRPIQLERVFVVGKRPDYARYSAGVVFRFN